MSLAAKALDTLADRLVVPGYSKIGFKLRERGWAPLPAGALRGRRVLVTGANSGLGKESAAALAELGAAVHLVVRDLGRGAVARDEIARRVPGAELHVERCDMSSLDSVREFAGEFRARHDEVHALVHNAGVLPPERTVTADGDELTLATHVLGPFLLTGLLLPALRRANESRVVFVSSGGMYTQGLRMDDPQYLDGPYRGATAYARTKRMQVVLARLWGRRLGGAGIAVHATHPGWAATPGVTDSLPGFARALRPLLRTPAQGADTAVWLAAGPEAGRDSGRFWQDRAPRPENYVPWTRASAADCDRLWTFCVERTGFSP